MNDEDDEPAIVTTPALRAEALSKRYGDAPALEPLDLTIESGQRVSLVGHNGSGKSTLLRLAAGLLEPTSGTVLVAGAPAGTPLARAALSYLGDQPVFYDDLSLWEHVEYIARLNGTSDWAARGESLLARLDLDARRQDLPGTFSRGLRQKAAIVLAFVRPFSLLLVDEPFVGLDQSGRAALLDLLADAHRAGAALLVATHDLASVNESQRVLALRDGTLFHDGPSDPRRSGRDFSRQVKEMPPRT